MDEQPVPGPRPLTGNGPRYVKRLLVKDGGQYVFVPVDELDWIESADNYVERDAAAGNGSPPPRFRHPLVPRLRHPEGATAQA